MNKVKKPASIQSIVNWFEGNCCARKCYEEEDRRDAHHIKLQELAKRLKDVKMTHREFLIMLRSDKTICDLDDVEWKARRFTWDMSKEPFYKKYD
jgi:hypothetical protein